MDLDTFMALRKIETWWWEGNCQYRDGEWYFRGYFKLKIIHENLPKAGFINDPEITKTEVPRFRHFSIHIERENGRMRYVDWEGNNEEYL